MIKAIQIQYDENFDEILGHAAKVGFQFISVGFGSMRDAFLTSDWQEIAPKINHLLKKHGIECVQTHLPYYDLRISSEILDDDMERAIKNCIETSAKIGAKVCVYHPRSSVTRDYSPRASLVDNVKIISGYNEIAKKFGIGIALENLPIFPDIQHMLFYTFNYEDLCELVDSLADENISVCWDFGHAHLTKFNHEQGLRYVGKRLSCTHIHNNTGLDDDHYPPSMGRIKWEELMPVLKEISYEGPLTLEVIYPNDSTAESYLAHCYSCAERLEAMMK